MGQHVMSAESAVELIDVLDRHGVDVCVGGGWPVDALLAEQTREHSDLDRWLPAAHLEPLFVAFARRGLDRILPWPGDRPWNFVLHGRCAGTPGTRREPSTVTTCLCCASGSVSSSQLPFEPAPVPPTRRAP